ncbi:hypothetical protein CAPN002_11730 [Capnocytophaga stomatis]|nr:hypothetical protein CAPN002_11730 [Capnocytophaga stomatis]
MLSSFLQAPNTNAPTKRADKIPLFIKLKLKITDAKVLYLFRINKNNNNFFLHLT